MTKTTSTPAPAPQSGNWSDWQKQLAGLVLIALVPVALWVSRPVLYPLVYMLIIAFLLNYPIRFLHRRLKLSYRMAVILVYLLFVLLVVLVMGWLFVLLIGSVMNLVQSFNDFVVGLLPRPGASGALGASGAFGGLLGSLGTTLALLNGLARAGDSLRQGFSSSGVMQLVAAFGRFATDLGLVVVVLLFFLLEYPQTMAALGKKLPAATRREYAILLQRGHTLFQNYMLGSGLIVLIYWLISTVFFLLTGVPNAVVAGLIVALPNFIPHIGGLFSAILVFFIALISGSNTITLNPLIFAFVEMAVFMLIAGITYYLVDVRIFSRSVQVPVWLLLLSVAVFSAAFGLLGLLVAAAALALLGELLDYVRHKMRSEEPFPGEAEPPILGG